MPTRRVLKSVFVHRDGKQVQPTIGKDFNFTAEELADINRMSPSALHTPVESEEELAAAQTEAAEKRAKDAAQTEADRVARNKAAAEKKAADAKAASDKAASDKAAAKASNKADAADL